MVSRRNFFTITVIMLVIVFMFQIPEVVKDKVNHYDKNEYEELDVSGLDKANAHNATAVSVERTGRFVVFIGRRTDGAGALVGDWCDYTKRYVEYYDKVSDYRPRENLQPEVILVDAEALHGSEDSRNLLQLAEDGNDLIFCTLPDVEELQTDQVMRKLLGIREIVKKEVTVGGIRLLGGFLLGGQKDYQLGASTEETQQDLDLTMPWYRVSSGTKSYMMGLLAESPSDTEYGTEADTEEELKNEDLPAIIWRNNVNGCKVFVVNGNYLKDNTGLGFLNAMMSELKAYDIYPVINAQNLVVINFPDLADENAGEMMERYSQRLKAVYRDIVWPGLVSVAQQNSLKLSLMIMPQMDYTDDVEPEGDTLIYYMKLFQEQGAETGLSGVYEQDSSLDIKLRIDTSFFGEVVPDYAILSFYQGNMTKEEVDDALERDMLAKVRTVFTDYQATRPLISYWNQSVLRQSGITDGYNHTFGDNLRMTSIQTALGYSTIQVDVNPVAYPSSDGETWEKLSKKFASNTGTYWKNYSCFDKTTLAESDLKVRRFLALDYVQRREGNEIQLELRNFDQQASFILRTHGEVLASAQGASFVKIEDGAYLIEAETNRVTLKLEEESHRTYY